MLWLKIVAHREQLPRCMVQLTLLTCSDALSVRLYISFVSTIRSHKIDTVMQKQGGTRAMLLSRASKIEISTHIF